ncbi:flagellar hook-length control protein FliK [Cupriavidus gilardii]|uniref:flagellar hook-length control protein FliK n=1 Tax=Cupriavidus gilardii TaxID=82541 RepID=UPI001573D3A8|nr:flagellar hook-length control protein FliK [Cupriavidus gilardii]MCG5261813.1 flagellar hook-length control protein FliK [Cupriavidus gilardii]MDF9429759.1 flagellar hook-length control protein FliK [Cupriavidus gilardii]NSX04164.1 flagellar hook-length control protein FliK [Cupriavidus gilardii]
MTAIHLPPGSPSGQSLDANTLRAQVSANKLAALIPTASPGGATVRQSDGTSTGAVEQPVRTGPQGQTPATPPIGSTRETLSFAARTILTLLAQGSAAPLRSAGPLLAVPPSRLPEGSMQVRQALMHLVQDSGLFYESHLAQWIAGERGLASLAREPQAGIGRHPYPGSGAPHGGTASGQGSAAGTYGAEPGAAMRPSTTAPLPTLPSASPSDAQALSSAIQALAAAEPSQAVLDAALNAARSAAGAGPDAGTEEPAATPRDTGARSGEAPRGSETPRSLQAAAQAYQAAANDAARQAGTQTLLNTATDGDAQARPDATGSMPKAEAAPAIHPDTEGIVRQQLELLATQQFRWAGEAWPGTPMQWDIAERQQEQGSSGEHGDGADERTWSSRLVLELPQLGTVEARLTLTPNGLETRLAVQEDRIARMLDDAQDRLRNNLGARGIDLLHFSIRRDTDAEGAA